MRLLIIALTALPLGAATAEPAPEFRISQPPPLMKPSPRSECPKPAFQQIGDVTAPRFRNLAELPPADAFHAVLRHDEKGCLDPVMVGYQHGRRYR